MNCGVTVKWLCVAVAALGVTATGCGKGQPATYPVTVTVTYPDKRPIVGAQVVLLNAESKVSSRGSTGTDGSCKLTTFSPDDGAVPGRYQVAVAKPPLMGDPDKPYSGPQIADKFANPATSGLEVNVTEDVSKNSIPLIVTAR